MSISNFIRSDTEMFCVLNIWYKMTNNPKTIIYRIHH